MHFRRSALILAAAGLAAACSKPQPVVLTLKGDSINPVVTMTYAPGVKSAECNFAVSASATGPKGKTVTLEKGRVVYILKMSRDTLMKRPIEGADLKDFFGGKNTVDVGGQLTSKRLGMSMSMPINPLEGHLTFDYSVDGKDTKTSEPYNFVCQ